MAKLPGPPGWSLLTTPTGLMVGVGILASTRIALKRAGLVLQSEWKDVLSLQGQGKTYDIAFRTIRGKVVPRTDSRRPAHRASAPGAPPAKNSGNLAAHIEIDDRNPDKIRVGSNDRNALAQEYGVNVPESKVGKHPDPDFKILPRPHKDKAWRQAEPVIRPLVAGTVRTGGRTAGL